MTGKTAEISGESSVNTGRSAKEVYVGEGLFIRPRTSSEPAHLLGSQCKNCDEVTFPRQTRCSNCSSEAVEQVVLSRTGTLYSFSNVNNPVPEGYKGPIPYGVGLIELPEGVRILAHLTESDPRMLRVGMRMDLVIDKLFTNDEGTDVIGFKFRPAAG